MRNEKELTKVLGERLNKMEIYIKELENRMKLQGAELSIELKSILRYLYEHQNRKGQIYMSIHDMIITCNLYYLGDDKDTLLDNVKEILCSLEGVVLEEYSTEQIEAVKDLDELLILEFKDILK